jgi:hypothetical protein
MLKHFFSVGVGDQERDIISLRSLIQSPARGNIRLYLDWLPPQNEEGFGALSEEAGELMDQDVLNFVCLLYSDADAHAVDTGLYEDLLILITGNGERVQQHFWGALCFDLGDIVSF